jgi:hypothetical protein
LVQKVIAADREVAAFTLANAGKTDEKVEEVAIAGARDS